MNESARKFLSGPITIDLRTQLKEIRRRAIASRRHPDLLWRKLCGVIATSGSSVNADRFLSKYDTHLRFDLLPTNREAYPCGPWTTGAGEGAAHARSKSGRSR